MLMFVADDVKELPLALQGKARLDGGKYVVPSGTDDYVPDNPKALRDALSAQRDTASKLTKVVTSYGWRVLDNGELVAGTEGSIDPLKARDALTKAERFDAEHKDLAKAREDLANEFNTKLARDIKTYELATREMESALADHLIGRDGDIALRGKGGDANTVAALMPTIRARARVEKTQAGKFVVRIYDDQNKQLISRRPGSAEPMDLMEYAGVLREDPVWKPNFPINNRAGGSGATHQAGGGSAAGGATNSNSAPSGELYGERALAALLEGSSR